MSPNENAIPVEKFHLTKWFLDYTGDLGDAMIFYSAKLKWHGLSATYTSWLHYQPVSGVSVKSRFRRIPVPSLTDDFITWDDAVTGISGIWKGTASPIRERLFDSGEGYLDWICHQPASKVSLILKDRTLKGTGYAEQLVLTAVPWSIPMDELRWGRFGGGDNTMVWIELRKQEKKQWLWMNGERIEKCTVEDDQIVLHEKDIQLSLDRGVVLESEKKIFSVVNKLIKFIPGFNKVMPLQFLMADEYKWLSKGELSGRDKTIKRGMAIHELVKFNTVTR